MIFGFVLGLALSILFLLCLYLFGANRELRKQVIPLASENEQLKDAVSKFIKDKRRLREESLYSAIH